MMSHHERTSRISHIWLSLAQDVKSVGSFNINISVVPNAFSCSFRGLLLLKLNYPHFMSEKNAPGGKLPGWKAQQLSMGCCLLCAWKQLFYTSAPLRAFWPLIRRTVSYCSGIYRQPQSFQILISTQRFQLGSIYSGWEKRSNCLGIVGLPAFCKCFRLILPQEIIISSKH